METTDGLRIRALHEGDLEAALGLSAEANWNQNAADWRYMLRVGRGSGIEAPDGSLAASAMLLPYGNRFAWIAMILVTRAWRRHGLATRLLEQAIAACRAEGWIAGLDATEAGQQVYPALGFRGVYAITRWMAEAAPRLQPSGGATPIAPQALARVSGWDAAIFGAERGDLLQALRARRPELALVAEQAGEIAGFCMARDGRVATQLGPLVASDAQTAERLLTAALARIEGPVFLDALDQHGWIADWLPGHGFRRQRGYLRMLLEREAPLDQPARNYLIAGPEFG